MQYQKLNKKALTCMYVQSAIRFILFTLVVLVVFLFFHEEWPRVVNVVLLVVLALSLLYVVIAPKMRYERYRYILTQEEFEVRKGLIVVRTEIVPIERLHKIEVSSGPIFRAFGLKKVLATTAGGDIEVSYLDDSIADQIAQHLKQRINTIAVEERDVQMEGSDGAE